MKEQYRSRVIDLFTAPSWLEIETITNYVTNSLHLGGVRTEQIKKELAADVVLGAYACAELCQEY
jgi:hypothetical protein